jgi:hypothetical protein
MNTLSGARSEACARYNGIFEGMLRPGWAFNAAKKCLF